MVTPRSVPRETRSVFITLSSGNDSRFRAASDPILTSVNHDCRLDAVEAVPTQHGSERDTDQGQRFMVWFEAIS